MRPEMSNLDFTIGCTVTFFSKKRRTPPNLNNGMYYPHFVIKGTEFFIMEGGNIVGEGIVKEIFQHKPYGSK